MSRSPATAEPAAVIEGIGSALPGRIVTNDDLSQQMDTDDQWIRSRTGIRQRRWISEGEATSTLAVEAGRRALKSAGTDSVDLVVLATSTPDQPMPATAPEVSSQLGLGTVPAFDVAAVCAGFVFALAAGVGAIVSGQAGRVLVIGADTLSTRLNPKDRTTRVIFGDGAGAVVLRAGTSTEAGALTAVDLGSDGTGRNLIEVPGGGSRQRAAAASAHEDDHYMTMRGREVFAQAVRRMGESSRRVLQHAGWEPDSVDWLVAHQANIRILHATADYAGVPRERVVVHLDEVGNTSAASIPLALADAAASGRLRPGDRILLTAFGAGLSWGSVALTWPDVSAV